MPAERLASAERLEILDLAQIPGERVKGHCKARVTDGPKLEIAGWALGVESPAKEVVVTASGTVAGRVPIGLERPDVTESFPDLAGAGAPGFRIELAARGCGESELKVWARLEDDSRELLGRVTTLVAGPRGLPDAAREP